MSKKLRLYSLLSLLGIYGVLNLIIFLAIFNGDMNNASFWIAWSFAYPVSYLLTLFIVEFTGKVKKYEDVTVAPTIITSLGFDLLFIVASFIFMFIKNLSYKVPLIVDLVLLLGFGVIEAILLIGTNYINRNDKRQKEKVFYIRDLVSDVEYISSVASSSELKKSLDKLAEDIRFSDPMSHESLQRVEDEIKELVFRLKENVENNEGEEINKTLKEINLKLKYRNEKCINLK